MQASKYSTIQQSILFILLVNGALTCLVDDYLLKQLEQDWKKSVETKCEHSSYLMSKPFLEMSIERSEVFSKRTFNCPAECDPEELACTSCSSIGAEEYRPDRPSTDPTADIRERSVCPWKYTESYNKVMRYPSTIVEASCLCEPAGGCPCFMASKGEYSCEPVTVPIPILVNSQKTDDNGRCIFEPSIYRLKVGCTCARVPTLH